MNFRRALTIFIRLAGLFFALHLPLFGQGSTFVVYAQGTGTGGAGNATAIQGVPIAPTLPGAGQCLGYNGTTWAPVGCTGAGGGTVTGFSSGNLAPLFTTSVATATSTPAQTFALSTALANTVFGNCTASTAAPSFCTLVSAQIPAINLAASGAGGVTGLLPHANIAATAVTPGPYTNANITVAADGTITAAANGSGGGGGTPCTTTALSIQYNSAGTFGCEPDLTFTTPHTLVLGASGIFTLTAGATLNGLTTTMLPTGIPNANLASQTANSVLGALTATTPSSLSVPSCSGASNALTWTSGSGFGCNTITGTGNTTSTSLTTNTIPKANGANSIINSSIADNGTTVSTAESITVGPSASTTNDGVHPSSLYLGGQTTVPGLTANGVTLLGNPAATNTAWSFQFPNAVPATTDLLSCTTTSVNCLMTDSGIAATSTGFNTLIKTLTGCNTASNVYTPQGADCVAPSGGGGFNGAVTYTTSQTASSSDAGKLVLMNCSSACAYTLPASQPSTTFQVWVMTIGGTNATIGLSGDTWNKGATAPVPNKWRTLFITANTAISNDYEGDAPISLAGGLNQNNFADSFQIAATIGSSNPNTASTNFGTGIASPVSTASFFGGGIGGIYVWQSLVGVGCSAGSNTVQPTITFNDPNGNTQTIAGPTLTISANGSVANGSGTFVQQIFSVQSNNSVNAITFTVASTLASTGCSTVPQYKVGVFAPNH